MTDDIAPSSAPASPGPAADPAPSTTAAPSPAPNVADPVPAAQPAPVEYKIPDAYKEKPWASKIKSENDLWKQLENTQELVGKKHAHPAKDAALEEWDKYFEALRPETVDAYNFGENHPNPEFAKSVGQVLFDAGVSQHQANKLIPAYQKLEEMAMVEATSADGFKAEMQKSFGEKFDPVVAAIAKEHKQHLSVDDQKILDAIPNQYLGVVYRLTAAMQKAYGAEEGGSSAHLAKGGQPVQVDLAKERSDLRQQIRDLEARPHTAQQKQELVDKLDATYREGKK